MGALDRCFEKGPCTSAPRRGSAGSLVAKSRREAPGPRVANKGEMAEVGSVRPEELRLGAGTGFRAELPQERRSARVRPEASTSAVSAPGAARPRAVQ